MGRFIGIDLGTTNSVAAVMKQGGCEVLVNRENEQQTRSMVGFHKGKFLVGSPALNHWALAPVDTIFSIKRLMGRAISDQEVEKVRQNKWVQYEIVEPTDGTRDSVRVKLGGKEYSPVDISAEILRKLKEDAEHRLGEEVTHAVITVPAYFSEKQCNATREAGLKAGLTVMRVLEEPTAAAIAFGISSKGQEAKTILVYDLGGGTFDISILVMGAGSFAPLNLQGDMWLGGDNFDQLIIDYAVSYIKKEYGIDPVNNKRFMVELRLAAQKVKETLSSARAADLVVTGHLKDDNDNIIDIELEITKEQYEDMIRPLVERAASICKLAVEKANLTFEDIDHVLMAGNATSVPMVQESMERLFGKEKILRKIHPKNCVAIGAVMQAAILSAVICPKCNHSNKLEAVKCEKCGTQLSPTWICPCCGSSNDVKDDLCKNKKCGYKRGDAAAGITPFPFGIQTEGDKFNVFIDKKDNYPTPEDKRMPQTFYTRYPNQRIISIPVYGGENLESASKNEKQGEAFAILPPNCPLGTPILMKFWLDENKIFHIIARLEDGTNLNPLILRGEIDQKAEELLHKSMETVAQKGGYLSSEKRKEVEKLRDEILKEMQKKEFEKAEKRAEELQNIIEDACPSEEEQSIKNAEGLISYAKYIVNNYTWAIGQDAVYKLNNCIGKLQEAVDKKDITAVKSRKEELNTELDKLEIKIDPVSGDRDVTVLGAFIRLDERIRSEIQPVEPAKANNLIQELKDIENAFKNGHNNSMDRLNAFISKFINIIKEIEGMPGAKNTWKCHCGYENSKNIRKCEKCGTQRDLLKASL